MRPICLAHEKLQAVKVQYQPITRNFDYFALLSLQSSINQSQYMFFVALLSSHTSYQVMRPICIAHEKLQAVKVQYQPITRNFDYFALLSLQSSINQSQYMFFCKAAIFSHIISSNETYLFST